jgi:hypothetical protein
VLSGCGLLEYFDCRDRSYWNILTGWAFLTGMNDWLDFSYWNILTVWIVRARIFLLFGQRECSGANYPNSMNFPVRNIHPIKTFQWEIPSQPKHPSTNYPDSKNVSHLNVSARTTQPVETFQ